MSPGSDNERVQKRWVLSGEMQANCKGKGERGERGGASKPLDPKQKARLGSPSGKNRASACKNKMEGGNMQR